MSALQTPQASPLQNSHSRKQQPDRRDTTPPGSPPKSRIDTPGKNWLPRQHTQPPSLQTSTTSSPSRDKTPPSHRLKSKIATPVRDWTPRRRSQTPPLHPRRETTPHRSPLNPRIRTPGRDWLPKQRQRRTPSPSSSPKKKRRRDKSPYEESKRSRDHRVSTDTKNVHSVKNFVKHQVSLDTKNVSYKNKKSKTYTRCSSPEKEYILDYVKHFFTPMHTLHLNYENCSKNICKCMSNSMGNNNTATSFKLKDTDSGWNFLVDTGACKSFVPLPKKQKNQTQPLRWQRDCHCQRTAP